MQRTWVFRTRASTPVGVPKRNRRLRMVSRVLGIRITAAEYTKATPDTTDRMMNLKLSETIRTLSFELDYNNKD